jgi:UDP-N-acetylmuramoyl-L-alanyl-D-glutamate--2,6-diaminopimelate ligase
MEALGLRKMSGAELRGGRKRGYLSVADRREAIKVGCGLMEPGDILLIAGKGHENYQILGRRKIHFDDGEEALRSLGDLGRA